MQGQQVERLVGAGVEPVDGDGAVVASVVLRGRQLRLGVAGGQDAGEGWIVMGPDEV